MTSPAVTPTTLVEVQHYSIAFTASPEFPSTPTDVGFCSYFHLSFFVAAAPPPVFEPTGRPAATPGVLGIWNWFVRDSRLQFVAQIDDYISAEFVARFNDVGTWSVQLPADAVASSTLSTPGAGVVVVEDGEIIFSGPTTKIAKDSRGDTRTFEISGVSDEVWLQRRTAVPNPDDGQLIGGAIPYPPTADVVTTGCIGTPDATNLYNNLDNDEVSYTIGINSQTGVLMVYRGHGTITPGFLSPYRITGVRVRAIGRVAQGVDATMLTYVRVGGTNYFGLGWKTLEGGPSEATGTWLTNPATGLAWTRAQIETLINSGGFGFSLVNPSVLTGDTLIGLLRLEVLSFAQDEYDNRANTTSTAMIRFADFNAGPSALGARQVTGLTMAADPLAGGTTSNQARYGNLLELEQSIATPHNLGFRVDQVGTGLVFEVYKPLDRTASVRFTPKLETMDDCHYEVSAPSANALYLGVSGEGVERTIAEPQDTNAIIQWGRIEAFVDRRDIKAYSDIPDASAQALAETAAATALEFTPVDQQQMRYREAWQLGDQVTVDIEGIPPPSDVPVRVQTTTTHLAVTVVEVGFKFDPAGPVTMTAKVGSPSPRSILTAFDRSRAQNRSFASRLRALETNR